MPIVSIIIPCYNEQSTIRGLLEAIHAQTYPRRKLEVIIADGGSTDNTRGEIKAFISRHTNLSIKVVDNPRRIIPAGLNRAIQAARGEIIIRLDAHSMPFPDYVQRCVEAIHNGKGENVGGIWEIRARENTWMAESIARAAAHPLGAGDALYRHATHPAYVDTVPFGAFKRGLIDRIGLFDETLLTNEDYEFNARVRKDGGRVWLDPAIRSVYFARPTLRSLSQQYWRYGFWKWHMLRRYPQTLRWRQALPPLFVLSLVFNALLGIFIQFFAYLLLTEILLYVIVLAGAGFLTAIRRRKASLVLGLPPAIATMHLSWGAGFLWSMINRTAKHG